MRSGTCLRQLTPGTEPSSALRRTIPTLLPVVALILLPAIAFASPPDPSWIAGIYDGGDGDAIVTLVYETAAADTAVRPHVVPLLCLPDMWLDGIVPCLPGKRFARNSRSPPLTFHGVCSWLQVCAMLPSFRCSHGFPPSCSSRQNRDGLTTAERSRSIADADHAHR
jgi:hypothetical protein